ncbi:hypothetical protein CBER1_00534 [Cercospora berteroae]|uniref:Uncharacterized protein n=1 Tax=Cercospora berteroae TaxID=357750 RepID=A0A2S6CBI7_9PEZI|nr:hypothetical protein CBER1_00534 [Cercospora berteroae]
MEPRRLDSLPPELQDTIISFVPRPSDLKALCLSCKQLHDIATPHLYRLVIIDISAAAPNVGFFTMGNPGHAHIKSLRFTHMQDVDQAEQHVDANKIMRLALYCLPKDSLVCLMAPKNLRMEVETLATIFTQQKALRELCIGSIRDAASQSSFHIKPSLRDLRSINMHHLGDERDLNFYSDIMVQSHENIRELALSGSTSTLKRLKLIYASGNRKAPWQILSAFDIVELAARCLSLEDIFLDFPTIDIRSLQGQDWADYGKWLDFLARLPRLRILHIGTWPTAPFPDHTTPAHMYEAAYHNLISQCALAIQRRIDQHRPNQSLQLKLLSFGSAPSNEDRAMTNDGGHITMNRLPFVRLPASLPSEDDLPSMVSVPARLVRYHDSNYKSVSRQSGRDHGSLWTGYNALTDRT